MKRLTKRRTVMTIGQYLTKNDSAGLKYWISSQLRHLKIDRDEFALRAGISRRTLYRMLSSAGNPTLENVCKIISELYKHQSR